MMITSDTHVLDSCSQLLPIVTILTQITEQSSGFHKTNVQCKRHWAFEK